MIVRWALVDENGERAAWERVARRVVDAQLTVVVEHLEQLTTRLDECDAIVYSGRFAADATRWSQLAQLGKHWLLGEPPASAPTDIRQASEQFRNAGLRLITRGAARCLPSNRAVFDAVRSGKLGIPGLVRIHRWQPGGGGSLVELMHADVDLACWLMGSRPTVVFARGVTNSERSQDFDYVQVHLGFVGDAMAMIDVSRQLPTGDDYYSLSVIGSTGAAYADDHHNQQLLFAGGYPVSLRTEQGDRQRLARLQHFLATIRDPGTYAAEVLDARRTLDVLSAVAESIAIDRAVQLMPEKVSTEVSS
jgi:predicted dehydrogenase